MYTLRPEVSKILLVEENATHTVFSLSQNEMDLLVLMESLARENFVLTILVCPKQTCRFGWAAFDVNADGVLGWAQEVS